MSTVPDRINKIIPILQEMVADDEKRLDVSAVTDQALLPFGPEPTDIKERAAYNDMSHIVRASLKATFRTLAVIDEVQFLAKKGVANALTALGYNAKTDATLDGYSGNRYYVSVVAPSDKRTLIVDQTLETSQFSDLLLNIGLRQTFDQFSVTIADFFKFLDISKGFGSKPSIYWLHNYKVDPQLAKALGFSPDSALSEMAAIKEAKLGSIPSEETIGKFALAFGLPQAGLILDKLREINDSKRQPIPFDVHKTAKEFFVPFLNTPLLDMLEAGILDPKSITDSRILKGICWDLGLMDFLNPPWPDFVMEAASRAESRTQQASAVLTSAEAVGHPARNVQALAISPEDVIRDPTQGIEILKQNNLVITDQKETFRLTEPGREYMKEVHMKPKVNALRKAMNDLASKVHLSVSTPAGTIDVSKRKDEDDN